MPTRRSFLVSPLAAFAGVPAEPPLVPRPKQFTRHGGAFLINDKIRVLTDPATRDEGAGLAAALNCPVSQGGARDNTISLAIDSTLSRAGREGYVLRVTPQRVTIHGSDPAGAYYAAQSLKQLLPAAAFAPAGRGSVEWSVPCLEVRDAPRFSWRGSLVDPARHFKPKAAILRYIDALAIHKINILHLHLTDDQGWRIEIKKYPKLAQIGSVRKETRAGHERRSTAFDGKPHGGFYTQDDIREIVAYAAARHVTVVPEIEMPGHAQAALAAYPEFGNTGEKLEVWTQWGVSKNVFGVSERTFGFLEDILTEVLALFPGRYVHVGGDEVPQDQWKASADAQARMKQQGLRNESELHTWFVRRINKVLQARGRTPVGWDDIIEGGATPGAVVMSWRGTKGGIEAARHGLDVVMTPHTQTYFDYYQGPERGEPLAIGGMTTLEKVYDYDPVPPEMTPEEARRVLGTQGQLWSEYIPTAEQMEYMAFPRMCALAEVAWTPRERRDYADFLSRLPAHLERLRAMGVSFRPLDGKV
jgi:hexosaminidase